MPLQDFPPAQSQNPTFPTGTLGNVLFFGAGGTVSQSSALFWDSIGQRLLANELEVGTSLSEGLKVSLSGATISITEQGSLPGRSLYLGTANTKNVTIQTSGGDSWIFGSLTGGGTSFYPASDAAQNIGLSALRINDLWMAGTLHTGLTTGNIVFPGATGDLTGSASLFWDNANTRLTVGNAYFFTAGTQNLFIGTTAGNLTLAGNQNVGIGQDALSSLTTAAGQFNTAVGYQACKNVTSGHSNTGVGTQALFAVNTGINNAAFGYSCPALTSGQQNTSFGDNSMVGALTNVSCSAFGYQSLFTSTADSNNIAIGANALYTLNGANNNVAVGVGALTLNQTGANNNGVGQAALGAITTGPNNCGFGQGAGATLTTGQQCVFIGNGADANANNYQNAIAIGYGAVVKASNSMMLGNASLTLIGVNTDNTVALGTSAIAFSAAWLHGLDCTAAGAANEYVNIGAATSSAAGLSFSASGTIKWYAGRGVISGNNDFEFYDQAGGAYALRLGTGPKIGFFTAAPVAIQTGTGITTGFTAGSGTAVLSASTFTGNLGSTTYTIGDIVFCLKKMGLITN